MEWRCEIMAVKRKLTIKEKLKNCYRILFENKPVATLTFSFKKCDDCEYHLKCEECAYKVIALAKIESKDNVKSSDLENDIIYKDFMKGTEK